MRNLAPDTTNLMAHQSRINDTVDQVRGSMPMHSSFTFSREGVADEREIRILPRSSGGFGGSIDIPFRLFDTADANWTQSSNYVHREYSEWRLDLNDSAIDLVNRKSGLIDGIAFANQRTYLIWALLDNALAVVGIGLTRKPFSAFTAIGGDGTAAKGEVGVTFTVANGFQFTVGARVIVRNSTQFNWGTITAITSSTAIVLTMDNIVDSANVYGVNITGVTSGEIEQMNLFRPWVVTATGQTLYAKYFNIMGELQTSSTGNITNAYRSIDEWRDIVHLLIFNTPTGVSIANVDFSLARHVPIWADRALMRIACRGNIALRRLSLAAYFGEQLIVWTGGAGNNTENYGKIALKKYCTLNVFADNTTMNQSEQVVVAYAYRVSGGMIA